MLIPYFLQEAAVENSVVRAKQSLVRKIPQFISKPSIQRDRKSLLSPLQDLRRNLASDCFLEDVLAGSAAEFKRGRYGSGALHQFVIQERRAYFERYRHTGAIYFC